LAHLPQPCISSESAHTPGPCYACNLVVASPDLKISSRSKVVDLNSNVVLLLGQLKLQVLASLEIAAFILQLVQF